MKAKMLAPVMVAIMVFASFSCVALADDTSAEASVVELPTMHYKDSAESVFELNEGEYHGYAYTLNFYVVEITKDQFDAKVVVDPNLGTWTKLGYTSNAYTQTNTDPVTYDYVASYTDLTPGGVPIGLDNGEKGFLLDLTPVHAGNGKYKVFIKDNADSEKNPNFYYSIAVEMVVKVGLVTKILEPVVYIADVVVDSASSSQVPLNNIDNVFNAGVFGHANVVVSDNSLGNTIHERYYFYAKGLPQGLSMSESGVISGIPKYESPEGTPSVVTVYIVSKIDGNTYWGTLNLTVGQAQVQTYGYDYKISTDDVLNPGYAIAYKGEVVTVSAFDKGTNTPATITEVTMISSNGYVHNTNTTSSVTLDTSGTGCYSVTIKCGEAPASTFLFYVLAPFGDINANAAVESM